MSLGPSGLIIPERYGNETTPEVASVSGYALLHFFSDAAYNLTGFNISYRSVCVSVCMAVCLSAWLCLSVCMSVCLSVCLHVCIPYLTGCLSVYLSVPLHSLICLSWFNISFRSRTVCLCLATCLTISMCACLAFSLCVCVSMWPTSCVSVWPFPCVSVCLSVISWETSHSHQ